MTSRAILVFSLVIIFFQSCKKVKPLNPVSQKIDSLFQEWKVADHPGGSIGVMKDGEIIFSKGYGLASLEYDVPNTDSTLFNID